MARYRYRREFSFAGFQATDPGSPLPGSAVDNELENVERALNGPADDLDEQIAAVEEQITVAEALVVDAQDAAAQAMTAAEQALNYAGEFQGAYNGGHTYGLLDRARHLGALYMSLQDDNIGHSPPSSPTYWARLFGIEAGFQLDHWRGPANAANTTVTGSGNTITLGAGTPDVTKGTEICAHTRSCKDESSELDVVAWVNVACTATAYIILALFRDDSVFIGGIYQELAANACFAGPVKATLPAHPGDTNSHKYSCRLYITNAAYSVGINGSAANPIMSAAARCFVEGTETAA